MHLIAFAIICCCVSYVLLRRWPFWFKQFSHCAWLLEGLSTVFWKPSKTKHDTICRINSLSELAMIALARDLTVGVKCLFLLKFQFRLDKIPEMLQFENPTGRVKRRQLFSWCLGWNHTSKNQKRPIYLIQGDINDGLDTMQWSAARIRCKVGRNWA